MKKRKEFWLLFVPLIVCTVLPILLFVTRRTESGFIGYEHYLRLLLHDSVFWTALFNTYCYAILFSVVAVIGVALVCFFIKRLKSRSVFYPVSVVLASVASFLSAYLRRVHSMSIASPVSVSVYEILFALQVGFLTVWIVWLAERLFACIKNKKST